MKTTYDYTVKSILERVTIVTVDGEDIEVPIVSDNFEPVFEDGMTTDQKTELRVQARVDFRTALRAYMLDYFRGKDIEEAQVVKISPTIQSIEGQTFSIAV